MTATVDVRVPVSGSAADAAQWPRDARCSTRSAWPDGGRSRLERGGRGPDAVPEDGSARAARTLTEARRAAGLSMTAVAQAMYVSRPTVSSWERGTRRPARYRWPVFAALLRLDEDQLAALLAHLPPARLDGAVLPSLALIRRRAGLRQQTLALRVGVAPTTLAMWESARARVAPDMGARLAEALDTDVAALAAVPPAEAHTDPRPLRRLRRAARMSRREAAVHLGISMATLSRYEAGERRPPLSVARRMATVYRRPARDVIAACGIQLRPIPRHTPWRMADVPRGIAAARLAAGLTKLEMGRAVGRSGQAVLGWETGRSHPPPDVRRRLELVLGLPVGTLPARAAGSQRGCAASRLCA